MAGTQAAYRYNRSSVAAAPQPMYEPDLTVTPGSGRRARQDSQTQTLVTIAATIAVVSVVIALLCVARISFNSMTVSTSLESQELTAQISDARAAGNTLEVQQGTLTSSARIKSAATELGMTTPESSTIVYLEPDVVVTNADGSLSFAASALRATGTAA